MPARPTPSSPTPARSRAIIPTSRPRGSTPRGHAAHRGRGEQYRREYPPLTDSNGNTWNALTTRDNTNACKLTLYYVVNPTVGSGHTFSVNVLGSPNTFPSITVTAWSGNTANPFETENGSTASATTIATGSVTPARTNGLVIAAACHDSVYASSVDSSFTISDDENGANSLAFGNVMAYIIETSIVAQNPTFSGDGSSHNWAAAIATFTSADGVVGGGMKCVIGGGFFGPGCM